MNSFLFISDRHGRAAALLSFEDGALGKTLLFEGSGLAEASEAWATEGIGIIREMHEETDAGNAHRTYIDRVPVTSAEAAAAVRLWVKQNGYIDLPLTRPAMRCAELIAKKALLPVEQTALITGLVGLDAERLTEVEEQLAII